MKCKMAGLIGDGHVSHINVDSWLFDLATPKFYMLGHDFICLFVLCTKPVNICAFEFRGYKYHITVPK